MNRVLHVGSGRLTKANLKGFDTPEWQEIRLDIDPEVQPDIVASITDLSSLQEDSYEAIYSSHNVEHIYPSQVQTFLKDCYRILKPGGFIVVTCPDLATVAEAILKFGVEATLYDSAMGPITALDILYGHIGSVAQGNEFMAHRGGFTAESLAANLHKAGFGTLRGGRRPNFYDTWFIGFKGEVSEIEAMEAGNTYLP